MRRITMLSLAAPAAAAFASLAAWRRRRNIATTRRRCPARPRRRSSRHSSPRPARRRRSTPRPRPRKEERLRHHHPDDPGDGLALHEPEDHDVRRPQAADPRLRKRARRGSSSRSSGCSRRSGEGAASRGDLRLVRGGLPLQGRDVRVPGEPGGVCPKSPRRGRRSGSGTPTWSRSTSGPVPQPDGVFSGMNPLMRPFNGE